MTPAHKTYFEQQGEFFAMPGTPAVATHGLKAAVKLSENLIEEEVIKETLPALRRYEVNPTLENLVDLADGLVDSVYVLLHCAHALNIPFDKVWDEVHRSNMAKFNPDGTVTRRESDGKVQKPSTWTPPNVHRIMLEHQTEQQYGADYMRTGMVR